MLVGVHGFVVFFGLEVGDDLGGDREAGGESFFQEGGGGVGCSQKGVMGEEQVDFHEVAVAGGAEADAVVVEAEFVAEGVELLADFVADFRVRVVEQADDCVPDELTAGPEDVECDEDGHDGVEGEPVGGHDQKEAGDDADAGPTVGEDVFAVCDEDDGVDAAAGADEVPAEETVDETGGEEEQGSVADVLKGEAVEPLPDGFSEDGEGGEDDHCALKACGEEGDALVAVEEAGSGRLEAEVKAEGGEGDGEDVYDRFGCVGEDGEGARVDVCRDLADEHEDTDGE